MRPLNLSRNSYSSKTEKKQTSNKKKNTLILDLDETLIHTRYERPPNFRYPYETDYNPDFVFSVSFLIQLLKI